MIINDNINFAVLYIDLCFSCKAAKAMWMFHDDSLKLFGKNYARLTVTGPPTSGKPRKAYSKKELIFFLFLGTY